MQKVFLDHQSSTPILPEVIEAMRPYFEEAFGNASSLHGHGLRARNALAEARARVATFVGASSPDEIIFTSSGTESVNLAIKGTAWSSARRGNHVILSQIEHPAVTGSMEFLEKQGFLCTRVGVDRFGRIDPAAIREAMTEQTILVAVHHANHDIGTIQPIREISEIAAERGVPLFVDATASASWLPIDVEADGLSLLSFAVHRFGGPKGAGVLYRNRRARLERLIHGGIQESGKRAGTENIPAIVGAGMAAEIAGRTILERVPRVGGLQKRLLERLTAGIPHMQLNGPEPGSDRVCNNLNISVEFVEGEGQLLSLDMAGIAVASGTSCLSRSMKVSPVLEGIGLDHSLALGSVILTLGEGNTAEEIDLAANTYARVVTKLRGMSPMWDEFQSGRVRSVIPHPVQGAGLPGA